MFETNLGIAGVQLPPHLMTKKELCVLRKSRDWTPWPFLIGFPLKYFCRFCGINELSRHARCKIRLGSTKISCRVQKIYEILAIMQLSWKFLFRQQWAENMSGLMAIRVEIPRLTLPSAPQSTKCNSFPQLCIQVALARSAVLECTWNGTDLK